MLVATMKENDPERDTQRKQFNEAIRFHEWACAALPLHYSYASFLISGLRVESHRRAAALKVFCKMNVAALSSARCALRSYWQFVDDSDFDPYTKMRPTRASMAISPEHLAKDGLWPIQLVLQFEELAADTTKSEVVRFYCAAFCLKAILTLRGVEMYRSKLCTRTRPIRC